MGTRRKDEHEEWYGEQIEAVQEIIDEDSGEITTTSPSPLYKEYENWSNGQLKSVDIVYGDDVRRLAYEIWLLKANRSNSRTAKLLEHELADELPRFPGASTIRSWRRSEEWDQRASDDIAQVAQLLNRRHFEKLFALTDEALEVKAAIIHNDHPETNPKRLDIIARSVDELLKLRGLGTAGLHAGGVEPPKAAARAIESASSVREASAALRDEILQEKGVVAGKKKHR